MESGIAVHAIKSIVNTRMCVDSFGCARRKRTRGQVNVNWSCGLLKCELPPRGDSELSMRSVRQTDRQTDAQTTLSLVVVNS